MKLNLGELADAIYAKKADIAKANKKVEELKAEESALENKLLAAMQELGTDIVRGESATVSISTTTRPQLQDFDAFIAFVSRRKAYHLFERRIAGNAYKEMRELLGKPIPGVGEFEQVRLNVRKV
jgi:hypothetical protein